MSALDYTLEHDDNYRNKYKHATLPCDQLLDKPDELAALSGPVKKYNIRDLGRGGVQYVESERR